MHQIIVDAELRSKLYNLREPLDLCDETGRVVARVLPVIDPSDYEPVEEPISSEELQRRRHEPGYSTEEVVARLESL